MRYLTSTLIICACAILLTGCSFPRTETKAALQVVTGDIPVSVFIDDQYVEKTPYVNKSIQPGQKIIRLDPADDRLLDHEIAITLKPGLMTVITWIPAERPELNAGVIYELEKIDSDQSELKITTIPDGAIINVPDQPQAFAPATLSLAPGEYEYSISLPAYRTQKHSVKLTSGYRTIASVTMARDNNSSSNSLKSTTASSSAVTNDQPTSTRAASISAQISEETVSRSATSSTEVITTGPRVKILPTGFRQNGVEGLRVRSAASPGASEVGFAPTGSVYRYEGVSDKGWHQIIWKQTTGWVSGEYAQLIRE